MARRARSKQAMQKIITQSLSTVWADDRTFLAIQLTDGAGFDDECIVKRIMLTLATSPGTNDLFKPMLWTVVQTQDVTPPTETTMYGDNLVICSGAATPSMPGSYNETITMRKLSGSSVWLCLNVPDTWSQDGEFSAIVQLHYVES